MDIIDMYNREMSIPEISEATGIALSTVRHRLKKEGVLRSRADAIRISGSKGKLGGGRRGKKFQFSAEHKKNLSQSMLIHGDKHALGLSLKPNGYIEITRGPNKGKAQHVAVMEAHIGRTLTKGECVHHIDGNRANNSLDNLQLMTLSSHTKHHRKKRSF